MVIAFLQHYKNERETCVVKTLGRRSRVLQARFAKLQDELVGVSAYRLVEDFRSAGVPRIGENRTLRVKLEPGGFDLPAHRGGLDAMQSLSYVYKAPARRYVTLLLRQDSDVGSVIECASGLEAIEEIRRSRPDLVFLDVQMPELDGFDVLEMLGADLPETVIFVTAYADYALRASVARLIAPRAGSLAAIRTVPTRSIGLL